MVRNICIDTDFLKIKGTDLKEYDNNLIRDLKDTLNMNSYRCVGMAANMIGEAKNVITFIDDDRKIKIMINPKILKAEDKYEATEGCLCLSGMTTVTRYKKIKVSYFNEEMKERIKTYNGFTAEIIQHEIDHLNGILV